MLRKYALIAMALAALVASTPAAAASLKVYSYDPADAATKARVDNGLTFAFDKNLVGFRVKEVFATQAKASALVDPADEKELGAPLARLLPAGAPEHALYRVRNEEEGLAMVKALCPGSSRGWLVFGTLRARQGLTVHALGDDPANAGKARLCATMNFIFHGEWVMPRSNPTVPAAQPVPPNSF